MEYPGCRNDVFNLIDEASAKFKPFYSLNKEKYDLMDDICDLVDEVVWEIDSRISRDAIDVEVDQATKEFFFRIVCDDLIVKHGRENPFFKLMGLVDSVRFSSAGADLLRIEIGVHGLWRIAV